MRRAWVKTSAVTNGLPSRSPPIQLPIRRQEGTFKPAHSGSIILQLIFELGIEMRELAKKRVVIIGETVRHLVEDKPDFGDVVPAGRERSTYLCRGERNDVGWTQMSVSRIAWPRPRTRWSEATIVKESPHTSPRKSGKIATKIPAKS